MIQARSMIRGISKKKKFMLNAHQVAKQDLYIRNYQRGKTCRARARYRSRHIASITPQPLTFSSISNPPLRTRALDVDRLRVRIRPVDGWRDEVRLRLINAKHETLEVLLRRLRPIRRRHIIRQEHTLALPFISIARTALQTRRQRLFLVAVES